MPLHSHLPETYRWLITFEGRGAPCLLVFIGDDGLWQLDTRLLEPRIADKIELLKMYLRDATPLTPETVLQEDFSVRSLQTITAYVEQRDGATVIVVRHGAFSMCYHLPWRIKSVQIMSYDEGLDTFLEMRASA